MDAGWMDPQQTSTSLSESRITWMEEEILYIYSSNKLAYARLATCDTSKVKRGNSGHFLVLTDSLARNSESKKMLELANYSRYCS